MLARPKRFFSENLFNLHSSFHDNTTIGYNSKNDPCSPKLQRCSPHQHPCLSSSEAASGSSDGNEGSRLPISRHWLKNIEFHSTVTP